VTDPLDSAAIVRRAGDPAANGVSLAAPVFRWCRAFDARAGSADRLPR